MMMTTLWRWNTGAPMDGVIRSDPGWFTWGNHVMHRTGKVYSWHRFPRIYRMGVRQAINLYTVGMGASLYLLGVWVTLALYGALTALSLSLGLWLIIRRGRRYLRNKRTVTPLASALAHKWGIAEAVAEKSLAFEPDWQTKTKDRMLVISLPSHFAAIDGEKQSIENLISNRMGRGCDFRWHTASGKGGGTLEVVVLPPLPSKVFFRDYLKEIAKNKSGEYVAGVKAGGEIERVSFMGDFVHHACSFNTGRGKSSYIMLMLAQILAQDKNNRATILDTKMESVEPFTGIPGVLIFADPEHIGDMVKGAEDVFKVMKYRLAAQTADPTFKGMWPMELLILEEGNDFSVQLDAWWQENKPHGAKSTPEFWRKTIAPILWQGRSVNVHMFAVFQSFMERFFGNLNLRPSFGLLALSGYKPNQFRAMVGTTPIPRAQKGKGRILLTDGDEEYWIQALYDDPAYLRAFAEANRLDTTIPVQEKVSL
jgi:hypothetical protein